MKLLACAAGIIVLYAGTPAFACPSPLTGKDAGGTTQNFGVTLDGSANCYGNIAIVDGANAANKATVTAGNALKVDGSAVTQPVSGTVTSNQGGAPWSVSGTVTVNQGTNPWVVSGGGGGGGATTITNSAGQLLGGNVVGQNNLPFVVTQGASILAPALLPSTGIWDGKNYASVAPANVPAQQTQTAIIVRNPDTGSVSDGAFTGSGNASQIALEKAIYAGVTSSIPSGSNTIGAVTQANAPWSFTCTSGCAGGGGSATTELVDSAGRQLGSSLLGTNNVPLITSPATIALTPAALLPATGIWDGKNYAAFAPPSSSAIAMQPALVAALSPNTPLPTGTNTIGAVTQSGGPWSISGTVTANQGGAPWTMVNVDTSSRQLGSSLPGANNVPLVTSLAPASLTPTPLLAATALWDGKNYAAFTPPSGSALAIQPALVTTLSPNTPLPAGTNVLGAVTQSGGPWSVSQSGAPWGVSIQQGGNTAAVNASSQLSVNCANCSGTGVSQQDATGFTFGTTNMVPVGGVYSAAQSNLTSGQAGVAMLTQGRILEVNHRNSAGQEIGQSLPGSANIPVQVNIASQVQNNTLVKSIDSYGQARTASMLTDGSSYAAITAPNKPPKSTDSAIVVAPSPIPSLQCPFIQSVSQTASTTTISNPGGKYLHVCSYKLVAAAAMNVGLIEGTGSTCGTGTTNLDGQGSSGSIALAANGGFQTGAGAGQVTIPMQVKGDNLCVVQSVASNVSGYVNYGIFN